MRYFRMSQNNFPTNGEVTFGVNVEVYIQDYDIRHFQMIFMHYDIFSDMACLRD